MNIAGIVKSSFIDYPGCASVVVFLGGCNFRCGYCHNPEVVYCREGDITLPDFFAFLQKRRRFVDAVCISGGEPTLYGEELYQFIKQIRELGYRVKLDTNGSAPDLLSRLLAEGMLDYVAMDIKGPWARYIEIAGLDRIGSKKAGCEMAERVQRSLAFLLAAGQSAEERAAAGQRDFSFELRTTVCRELINAADIRQMAGELAGAPLWYLQTFQKQGRLLDEDSVYSAYGPNEMRRLCETALEAGFMGKVLFRE